jgi:hypothetical protein
LAGGGDLLPRARKATSSTPMGRHVRARLGEHFCDCRSNPRGGPGDQRGFPFKTEAVLPTHQLLQIGMIGAHGLRRDAQVVAQVKNQQLEEKKHQCFVKRPHR